MQILEGFTFLQAMAMYMAVLTVFIIVMDYIIDKDNRSIMHFSAIMGWATIIYLIYQISTNSCHLCS